MFRMLTVLSLIAMVTRGASAVDLVCVVAPIFPYNGSGDWFHYAIRYQYNPGQNPECVYQFPEGWVGPYKANGQTCPSCEGSYKTGLAMGADNFYYDNDGSMFPLSVALSQESQQTKKIFQLDPNIPGTKKGVHRARIEALKLHGPRDPRDSDEKKITYSTALRTWTDSNSNTQEDTVVFLLWQVNDSARAFDAPRMGIEVGSPPNEAKEVHATSIDRYDTDGTGNAIPGGILKVVVDDYGTFFVRLHDSDPNRNATAAWRPQ